MSDIAVFGGGYVGLVTAVGLAYLGHSVKVIEADPARTTALKNDILPLDEPGLPEMWQRVCRNGNLSVTGECHEGLRDAKFIFIAVGTPACGDGCPDLSAVLQVARSIAEAANDQSIVIIKSTVPVGTADLVSDILGRTGQNGSPLPVVSNPEFLREGTAVQDFLEPTRIVIGASGRDEALAVQSLYRDLQVPVVMCDNRTAEMSKYASNAFLAARVSFMNEVARICDEYNADIVRVAEILQLDPRIGKGYLNAGLGWGGSCLPKDIKGLIHMAGDRDVPVPLLQAVQEVNERQPDLVIGKLRGLLGDLTGKTIGILGLSFKPGSSDMRESRSLLLVQLLQQAACHVKAYDPVAVPEAVKLMPTVRYCRDPYEVAADSDAMILVTEWNEFLQMDFKRLAGSMKTPVLVDSRNLYDAAEMMQAGFIYRCVGRPGSGACNQVSTTAPTDPAPGES